MMNSSLKVRRNRKIGYLNPKVPRIKGKLPKGDCQSRLVPDTLDIAHRSRLALRAMYHVVDHQYDYEMYFLGSFQKKSASPPP